MADQPTVRPGQVWADNDPRSAGRHVLVVALTSYGQRAEAVRCLANGKRTGSRTTYIRIDRMRPTSTGYRLVRPAPTADHDPDATYRARPVETVHLPAHDIA